MNRLTSAESNYKTSAFPYQSKFRIFVVVILMLSPLISFAETPAVGSQAPDFTLRTPAGKIVKLSHVFDKGPLVLIVLRGYPGYQCPFCQKQVHDFIIHARDFASRKANVLLVYPGPGTDLDQHAKEFLEAESQMPANVVLVIDPNYTMTNLYGLRWDAPHETAYPSTFVLGKKGAILFEKISHSHGDRLSAEDALGHLPSTH